MHGGLAIARATASGAQWFGCPATASRAQRIGRSVAWQLHPAFSGLVGPLPSNFRAPRIGPSRRSATAPRVPPARPAPRRAYVRRLYGGGGFGRSAGDGRRSWLRLVSRAPSLSIRPHRPETRLCVFLSLTRGLSTRTRTQRRRSRPGRPARPGPGPRMFRRDRAIPLRGSAAALCNNLSVLQQPGRNLTHLAVVHGPCAQLLSVVSDGVPLAQRQLHAKERAGVSPPLITQVRRPPRPGPCSPGHSPRPDRLSLRPQVRWCVLPFRVLLVLTSHRGIQVSCAQGPSRPGPGAPDTL